ncbi:metallophosphoesterase [Sorangium sp. So ce1014]|uniref:metallophosphoesterase n=1 Tax=Sorangium sp. So ce1014 TaxID=3133326 RepID=UPI003F5D7614
MARRQVFIISDLHLGGAYPSVEHPRGFRILTRTDVLTAFVEQVLARSEPTELVINGDFVDFLAEEDRPGRWVPFVSDPEEATRRLDRIVERDAPFFRALRDLVHKGHRLTVLLGNHDIELSLPLVRRRLKEHIGALDASTFSFVYDGEAYVIGDALIEHGNRYDGFNIVDHDKLRQLRSVQSRLLWPDNGIAFKPPAGSRLVTNIMNEIKGDYPFVDLLKPETEATIPILLAIDPGLRRHFVAVLRLHREANKHAPVAPGRPRYASDMAASTVPIDAVENANGAPSDEDLLVSTLADVMGPEDARSFVDTLENDPERIATSSDIAGGGKSTALSLVRLAGMKSESLERRLPVLLTAVRTLQNDKTFEEDSETDRAFLDAATRLASVGFRWIIFGHTHLAKKVSLGDATYLNTGTWADLIRFPKEILSGSTEQAMAGLRTFVHDLRTDGYKKWIKFAPTYVRLDVDDDTVKHAELIRYTS